MKDESLLIMSVDWKCWSLPHFFGRRTTQVRSGRMMSNRLFVRDDMKTHRKMRQEVMIDALSPELFRSPSLLLYVLYVFIASHLSLPLESWSLSLAFCPFDPAMPYCNVALCARDNPRRRMARPSIPRWSYCTVNCHMNLVEWEVNAINGADLPHESHGMGC